MLQLKVTHQSPEKVEEHRRNHLGEDISNEAGTLRAGGLTRLAAGVRPVRFS
jgi:hypothetical protein